MGICHGKPIENQQITKGENSTDSDVLPSSNKTKSSSKFPFYNPHPLPSWFKNTPVNSNSNSNKNSVSSTPTPLRIFKCPFPAKVIQALLDRFDGLDKSFGFSKQFLVNYELREEVHRGRLGYVCSATVKKGTLKGLDVAVKIIHKSKLTTAFAVENIRREVKILRALTGHKNLVQFYEAYEDDNNVYIVMELCKGGNLLDRIISRGGKYPEEDAKVIMIQILSAVGFCHLQGVVHSDIKPENFVFTSKDENSTLLKAIDFGISDYLKPDERSTDIAGSPYYMAPEVLHKSYGTEVDMWSIGVIAYMLLYGRRPFWGRTLSCIFEAVLKGEPSFDEAPWPSLSTDAIDFVKKLLCKDYRKRLTAAQALSHPWLVNHHHGMKIPLDMIIHKLVKAYICSSSLHKSALRALAKMLTVAQIAYLRDQFTMLGPNKSGFISMQNFKTAVLRSSTDASKDSRVLDYVNMVSSIQYKKLDFEEFCAAAVNVYQLEGVESWEQHANWYELFEKDGNRPIMIEDLASELGLSPSEPVHAVVLQDWIRHSDGKLSFLGFVKLLHGVSSRTFQKA